MGAVLMNGAGGVLKIFNWWRRREMSYDHKIIMYLACFGIIQMIEMKT